MVYVKIRATRWHQAQRLEFGCGQTEGLFHFYFQGVPENCRQASRLFCALLLRHQSGGLLSSKTPAALQGTEGETSTTMAEFLENRRMADVLSILLETPDKIKLDIAISGVTGAGKSALVNALRGLGDREVGAAQTGVRETTMEVVPYQHPKLPSVTIWDLPGIGTNQFTADTYLQQVNFDRYDFFIIVSCRRLGQNDILLAKAIKQLGKKFYFVRTKVDLDLESARRQQAPFYDEEGVLRKIRDDCMQSLREAKFTSQGVFLLSRYDLNKYDFHRLEETLEKDLPVHKQRAFILALPSISMRILQKKKAVLKKHAWEVATVSCGVTATPTPGIPFACDTSLLLPSMLNYYQEFGVDDESLAKLARLVQQPEEELRAQMKSPPSSALPLRVGELLTNAEVGFFHILFSPLLLLLGSPAAGRIAFMSTLRMLEKFVDDLEEDAERVLSKAVGRRNV
ncbi:interferon-inducible GTPase 5-like [Podarcis lilfordi]|uniref:Interferon-inducible GTPase 5-like n=1 Tax=Podarcis lilfordi TaxID=74358 RepID=A0AA35KMY8_9SAUR|nr:interferon-inducible GTPase 5-like [Podarcis lilfordi]